jgi:hypothetical protein
VAGSPDGTVRVTGQNFTAGMTVVVGSGGVVPPPQVRDPVPEEVIEQVTIGVDPSGGGDEIGIVVTGLTCSAPPLCQSLKEQISAGTKIKFHAPHCLQVLR